MSDEYMVYSVNFGRNKKLIVTNKRIIITKQQRLADSILIAIAFTFCTSVAINFSWRLALLLLLFFAVPLTFYLALRRIKEEKELKVKGRHFHLQNTKIVFAKSRFSKLDPVQILIENAVGTEKLELDPKQAEKLFEVLQNLKAWTLQTYKV